MQVTIIDARPDWMKAEDELMACMSCHYFRRCKSRIGYECKHLGGTEIPKVDAHKTNYAKE